MPCSCQGAGKPETDITLRYPDKTAELNAYLDALPLEAHPDRKRGVLIQSLHRAQQIFGYLPAEVQALVARKLEISIAEVYGVISFYSYFTDKPEKYHPKLQYKKKFDYFCRIIRYEVLWTTN